MPSITLVRHGRPACDHRTRIPGRAFAAWVADHDRAALDPASQPPSAVIALALQSPRIITSTLRRSTDSAALLAPGRTFDPEPMFDEVPLPTDVRLRLALRPTTWDALARAAWLLHLADGSEPLAAAVRRANRAAEQLASWALQEGRVLLVGHGMLNFLLARALKRHGWSGSRPRFEYWSAGTLRLDGRPVGGSGPRPDEVPYP